MNTYTLYELNEYLRRVIALNVPRAIWVTAEIAQSNMSRGHLYLQLIQKEDNSDELLAKSDAVVWAADVQRLKRKMGKDFDSIIQEGMEVRIAVRVDFHERYGLKLVVEDLDPIFTIGKLEVARRETIASLGAEGLLTKNKALPFPVVLQRIALISSETAAGYQDFMTQLAENSFGYRYSVKLFPAAMQGNPTSREVIQQLDRIQRFGQYDCVVITRGGGARLDLMAFDDYELNKAVANCRLPVLAGVGHETDDCVLDLVAYVSLKTPTAVAEFLINHNMRFETMLLQLGQDLFLQSQQQLGEALIYLEEAKQILRWQSQHILKNESQQIRYKSSELQQFSKSILRQHSENLSHLDELRQFLSPQATLNRGYSLTTKDGKILKKSEPLKMGDLIETHVKEGTLISEIKAIKSSQL